MKTTESRLELYLGIVFLFGLVGFIGAGLILLCTKPDEFTSDFLYYFSIFLALTVMSILSFHIGRTIEEIREDERNTEPYSGDK